MEIQALIGKTIKDAKEFDHGHTVGIRIVFTDNSMMIVSHDRGEEFSDMEFQVQLTDHAPPVVINNQSNNSINNAKD